MYLDLDLLKQRVEPGKPLLLRLECLPGLLQILFALEEMSGTLVCLFSEKLAGAHPNSRWPGRQRYTPRYRGVRARGCVEGETGCAAAGVLG